MEENDPRKLARDLEAEADELEDRSEGLEHETSEARQDWQNKRDDLAPPGPGAELGLDEG